MVWHIIWANILLTVNIIFTDGIRMFSENSYLKIEIEAKCKTTIFFCSGIINLLFDGLAYHTSGHFAHCSYFFSPLRGSKKICNSQNICTHYMLDHRVRCIYCRDVFLLLHIKHFLFIHLIHHVLIINW